MNNKMTYTEEIQRYVILKRRGKDSEATDWVNALLDKYKDYPGTVQLLATLILILGGRR